MYWPRLRKAHQARDSEDWAAQGLSRQVAIASSSIAVRSRFVSSSDVA